MLPRSVVGKLLYAMCLCVGLLGLDIVVTGGGLTSGSDPVWAPAEFAFALAMIVLTPLLFVAAVIALLFGAFRRPRAK